MRKNVEKTPYGPVKRKGKPMDRCPKCGNFSVTFDSYHGIVKCITNFCNWHDENSSGPTRINSLFYKPYRPISNRQKEKKDD
jgi:ribosomal protein S27E